MFNLDEMEFVATHATYASPSLLFQADNIRFKNSPTQIEITGNADFRADLARLTNWFSAPGQPPEQQISGEVVGQIRLTHQAGLTTANVRADIRDFAYSTPVESSGPTADQSVAATPSDAANWRALWSEPVLTVAGLIGYTAA